MIDIFIKYHDIEFSNVTKDDLKDIHKSLSLDKEYSNKSICFDYIYERFLEYYISENEFCLKFKNKDSNIGIIKGRMEFANTVEIWLNCFYIYEEYRNNGQGSKMLDIFTKEIKKEFLVDEIYLLLSNEELKSLSFWYKNGYSVIKNIKKHYNYNYDNFIILKKGR
ncbi:GNAT family N-acetyltransferase [Clostridium cochlearium]|uniref:GNAT family N-acetyltransferase n=1 Tax=Clostridium cochlearium TaxID=1494 RepID=UPI000B94DE27|nr:GNAT family N-acetyltransferase [Clostridium cochlearium]MCR1971638.1 GNAT family N-acetyltransferase [Clostridium cochlearium]SNV85341.1 GNAT family acetyltransferase [Clostridium cochlearium]STA93292.1 GNAT family acetyltransferase [Clostridium cochlearium]